MYEFKPSESCLEARTDPVAKVHQFARRTRTEATLKNYQRLMRIFAAWCEVHGRSACPASGETMMLFLSDLAGRYRFTTITLFVDAIAFVHRVAGEPFNRASFRSVMQGIRRTHGNLKRRVAPIMAAELRAMVATLPDTTLGKRDRALLSVGFAGALRCGELVGLDIGTPTPTARGFVELDAEGAHITLLRSKTDQVGKGIYKLLPRGGDPCPVQALEAWLAAADITAGPAFRTFLRLTKPSSKRLGIRAVSVIVKRAVYASARQMGQTEEQARARALQVSTHSLRAGFVTSAAIANVPMDDIATHVGWKHNVSGYRYIRQVDSMTNNPAQRVLMS